MSGAESGTVLITGGAGFIGSNLACRLLSGGRTVVLYDTLSRPGTERNLERLLAEYPRNAVFVRGDVRDAALLAEAVKDAGEVYHFAAQVAVTTSITDPVADFRVNLEGTLNLLEAVRRRAEPPFLLFTSTNKVYGNLSDIMLGETPTRWEPSDRQLRGLGVNERRPLEFHSPYGCSKGAADQYVLDYARVYGIPAVVFRMSCIYGPRQFGTEDQGWVAHFLIRALSGRPITLYGDGKQVRDILFVEDLVEAMRLARLNRTAVAGRAFNIGGTAENTVSLLELLELISELTGRPTALERSGWRQGDQRYYVSDASAFTALTGWRPRVPVREGVSRLAAWLRDEIAAGFGSAVSGNGAPAAADSEPGPSEAAPAGSGTAGAGPVEREAAG